MVSEAIAMTGCEFILLIDSDATRGAFGAFVSPKIFEEIFLKKK